MVGASDGDSAPSGPIASQDSLYLNRSLCSAMLSMVNSVPLFTGAGLDGLGVALGVVAVWVFLQSRFIQGRSELPPSERYAIQANQGPRKGGS